ncbi:hypothetical protein B0T24DRAFT_573255, partial [Lasiosphaeria ovina]
IPVGPGPHGNRVVYPVTGGTFKGPSINGTVLPVGADFGLIDPKTNVFAANVRYQIRTSDGADIQVTGGGPQQPGGKVHIHLAFETGSDKYYYLNNIKTVAVVTVGNGGAYVFVKSWKLESPRAAKE